ncbi:ABC transporter permease [uncultured Thiodictyon sp.]|uniref:ABC transporter permease n=1 Tax=uncultured Thiodictyon sp. TaxID=1846217 RepID=UPI0025F31DD7|nr:ABC transporter permease [uncultured Thiodictyon sp.]
MLIALKALPVWPFLAYPISFNPQVATRVAQAAAFPLLVLLLWQAAYSAKLLSPVIMPSPGMVVTAFGELWASGDLSHHLHTSVLRVVHGFLIGALLGLGLGLVMGVSRLAEALVYPLFRAFCQVPTMAWLPLMMVLFGIGEGLKIIIITKSVMVPMCINTFEGVRGIPERYFEVARALCLSRRTLLRRLVLPAVFPPMFTGVRLGLSHAWVSLVGVELLASTEGIGYVMHWGRTIFQLEVVFVGVLIIGAVGLLMDVSMRGIEHRLGDWRKEG